MSLTSCPGDAVSPMAQRTGSRWRAAAGVAGRSAGRVARSFVQRARSSASRCGTCAIVDDDSVSPTQQLSFACAVRRPALAVIGTAIGTKTHEVVVARRRPWHLRSTNTSGPADISFSLRSEPAHPCSDRRRTGRSCEVETSPTGRRCGSRSQRWLLRGRQPADACDRSGRHSAFSFGASLLPGDRRRPRSSDVEIRSTRAWYVRNWLAARGWLRISLTALRFPPSQSPSSLGTVAGSLRSLSATHGTGTVCHDPDDRCLVWGSTWRPASSVAAAPCPTHAVVLLRPEPRQTFPRSGPRSSRAVAVRRVPPSVTRRGCGR